MRFMLCRNRVSDFRRWRRVFDSHAGAHRAAGLWLKGLWRDAGRPRDVYFLFEVRNPRRARAFISSPKAAEAAAGSGVIDGEYHFIRDAGMAPYGRTG
jgi:hypothetical protein